MKEIKLSKYAKLKNRCYRTMWNKFNQGLIPNAYKDEKGSIYIKYDDEISSKKQYNVIYARVSSNDQKEDLTRQIHRVNNFAVNNGYKIDKIYKEIASCMNDKRKTLLELLDNNEVTNIFIENKDRLTRFGFNYIENLLKKNNVNIIITSNIESKNDLIDDFVSVITSFCSRIYGQRRSKNNVKKILDNLKDA